MRVLMITPYVTITSRPEFSRNKTGFGYMVMDIARAVGRLEQVYVLATETRGEEFEHDGVRFLRRSFRAYMYSMWRGLSPMKVLQLWRKYRMRRSTLLRLCYYWLMTGYLYQLLRREDYDIVHIHGCGFATELWLQVCRRVGQKFVVTLHGLNSFSDTVGLEPAGKKYERDFLQKVVDGEIPITVISSGIKRMIERTYGRKDCQNIMVVCNSFSFMDANRGGQNKVNS